jgi:hypothetical protein
MRIHGNVGLALELLPPPNVPCDQFENFVQRANAAGLVGPLASGTFVIRPEANASEIREAEYVMRDGYRILGRPTQVVTPGGQALMSFYGEEPPRMRCDPTQPLDTQPLMQGQGPWHRYIPEDVRTILLGEQS